MNIPALSTSMNQANLSQQVNVSLMKKAMNVAQDRGNAMTEMLNQSTVQASHPTHGNRIDVKG